MIIIDNHLKNHGAEISDITEKVSELASSHLPN